MQTVARARMNELDKLVNDWNVAAPTIQAWPNQLQVVKVERLDTIRYAFEVGRRVGFCSIERWIRTTQVRHLIDPGYLFAGDRVVHCMITRPPDLGNAGDRDNHNMIVVVNGMPGDMWSIEVGCAHSIAGRKLDACLWEGRCTKCEYRYEIDSSD